MGDQQNELGVYMKSRLDTEGLLPTTFWDKSRYSASDYGTNLLTNIFGIGQQFSFPKSVHAVEDCLKVLYSLDPNCGQVTVTVHIPEEERWGR